MSQEKQGLNITANDLKEIVKAAVEAAVAESRKPAELTEAQKAQIQSENDMRRQQAELVKQITEQKQREQEACQHVRRDGSTPGVYVQDGNYIICQHCQKVIRPDAEPQLFNKLMQLQAPAIF